MNMLDKTVGKIACELPGATAIFEQFGLNFCCGGNKSLKEAIFEKTIDETAILNALSALSERNKDAIDWAKATDSELIDHVLQRYHQTHRQQLPELIRLSRRVENVHGERPGCPIGLADHLEQMAQALEAHMQKEEQILFPMLKAGKHHMARAPIRVMLEEHNEHNNALAKIRVLTNDITLPQGACTTWRALYTAVQAFVDDIQQHIHLENSLLFVERNHA